MTPRRVLASLVLVAAAAAPTPALADATADQRAAAQALFDDARRLMGEKKYGDACPKLEESQRLDPGLGTLLNLAECQALTGRTASAWANFLEAAYQAKAAGQTKRENTARARAAALEPRLSRLTILAVTGPAGGHPQTPGGKVEIKRDGVVVASSLVGTAVPVDPGEHVVSATAPGKKAWESKVTVKADGHSFTVSVPQLEDAPAEPPPEVKPPPPPEVKPPPPPEVKPPPQEKAPPPDVSAGKTERNAGVVLTVLGFGGLGVAAGFTVLTKIRLDDSNGPGGCVGNLCPSTAFNARNDARADGTVATGAWIGGGVVAATGLALIVASGVMRENALKAVAPSAFTVLPSATFDPARGATLGLTGRF